MKIQAKKGQAAMEFIFTYGWAILAAIIAIGVLAYFGVFSPQSYQPQKSTEETFCNSYNLIYDESIPNSCILIQNNTVYVIKIVYLNDSYYFRKDVT